MNEKCLRTLVVSVVPRPSNSNEVDCDISGGGVIDQAIFAPKEETVEIFFELPEHGSVSWARANPFCANRGRCPPPEAQGTGGFVVDRLSDKRLRVEARGSSNRSVFHYRLNFDGGKTCDPIIIRD